jgi:hypothetical protein
MLFLSALKMQLLTILLYYDNKCICFINFLAEPLQDLRGINTGQLLTKMATKSKHVRLSFGSFVFDLKSSSFFK